MWFTQTRKKEKKSTENLWAGLTAFISSDLLWTIIRPGLRAVRSRELYKSFPSVSSSYLEGCGQPAWLHLRFYTGDARGRGPSWVAGRPDSYRGCNDVKISFHADMSLNESTRRTQSTATNWNHLKCSLSLWVVWMFSFDLAGMRVLFLTEGHRKALQEKLFTLKDSSFRFSHWASEARTLMETFIAAKKIVMTVVLTVIYFLS